MGRPELRPGTYGNISCVEVAPKKWKARALYRDAAGRISYPSRTAATKAKAIDDLREALSHMAGEATAGEINRETRFKDVVDLWLDEVERATLRGKKSKSTLRSYRSYCKNWVKPALGELRCREVKVLKCEKLVVAVSEKLSIETAGVVRAILSGICGYAVRHEAMPGNPIDHVIRLERGPQDAPKEIVSLNLEQRIDLIKKLEKHAKAREVDKNGTPLGGDRTRIWRDQPDLVRAMLATGIRIGELTALSGSDVVRTVEDGVTRIEIHVDYHLIAIPGEGVLRIETRKGRKGGLVLKVPEWSVSMWNRRKMAAGEGPLFPGTRGGWIDPGLVGYRLRQALDRNGYEWVTSHVFRKTVAAVLDEADLPTTAIADQLGNDPKTAEKHYRPRRASNQQQADALEGIVGA